uniref:CSON005990 protein n=1 Tax=Culicoides sonorensis TaxID=179676 RepID=A0A336LVX0_CULSO
METEHTCRICLKPSQHLEPIFDDSGSSLIHKFNFLSIELLSTDDLPKGICEFCKSKLYLAYQFKEEVLQNEEKLRNQCKILVNVQECVKASEFEHHAEIEVIEHESESNEDIIVINIESPLNSDSSLSSIEKKKSPRSKKSKPLHLDKSIKTEKIILNGKTIYKKECPICHTLQQNLKQHLIVHSATKKHKCQICDKEFSQVSNLNNHLKLHDPNKDKERLKCNQCDSTFTDPRSLKRHEVKHTGERKYKCEVCPKSFLYSHNLLNHKRSHLQDKRYKCEEKECDKAYVTSGELKRHVTNAHLKSKNNKSKIT